MCRCNVLSEWISNLMYMFEKLSACCAFAAIVLCLAATLVIVWAFGVGLGYNHCYIEYRTSTHNLLYYQTLVYFTSTQPPTRLLRTMDDSVTMKLGESLLLNKIYESTQDPPTTNKMKPALEK